MKSSSKQICVHAEEADTVVDRAFTFQVLHADDSFATVITVDSKVFVSILQVNRTDEALDVVTVPILMPFCSQESLTPQCDLCQLPSGLSRK